MPLNAKASLEFLKFISVQEKKRNFKNLELLLDVEEKYPGMFVRIMLNFDKVKKYRMSLDENGLPIRVSWEEAFKNYCINQRYRGVTSENEDIAEVFGPKNVGQEIFEKAVSLRQEAKNSGVKEHILGHPLREDTIIESLNNIKNKTQTELLNGEKIVEELYEKQFTYEWLSKYDPHNGIIGLFTDCCCTIRGMMYGKKIAEASIIAPDVQNLVIRNYKGDIVAKGAVYVNKKNGYAVINDFELNRNYRKHESIAGRYRVLETDKDEEERELIFKQFQNGLHAFVEDYNKQNKENPLRQINVGMGYNRLKRQVERFKKATSNLTVPISYGFHDALEEQYIIYQRDEKEMRSEERDR